MLLITRLIIKALTQVDEGPKECSAVGTDRCNQCFACKQQKRKAEEEKQAAAADKVRVCASRAKVDVAISADSAAEENARQNRAAAALRAAERLAIIDKDRSAKAAVQKERALMSQQYRADVDKLEIAVAARIRKEEETRIAQEYKDMNAAAQAAQEAADRRRLADIKGRRQQEVCDQRRLSQLESIRQQAAQHAQERRNAEKAAESQIEREKEGNARLRQANLLAIERNRLAAEQQCSLEADFKSAVQTRDVQALETLLDSGEYAPSNVVIGCLEYLGKLKVIDNRRSQGQRETDTILKDTGRVIQQAERCRLSDLEEAQRLSTELDAKQKVARRSLPDLPTLIADMNLEESATEYHSNDGIVAFGWLMEALAIDGPTELQEHVRRMGELTADQSERTRLLSPLIRHMLEQT